MCIKQDQLAWNRCNQKLIWHDKYVNINQGLNENIKPNRISQRTILSSSFTRSPRYIEQGYQNAITLVEKFSKPDLFITFTTNPKWPEI
jgi:S-adenosylmethionine:tRNA-ribosyltransferase-isomerase (queuine synthetase)